MKFFLIIIFLFSLNLNADEDNATQEPSEGFIDKAHSSFSLKIKGWGVDIDDMVLGIYGIFGDVNSSAEFDNDNSLYLIPETNSSYSTLNEEINQTQNYEESNQSKKISLVDNNISVFDSNISKEKDKSLEETLRNKEKEIEEFFLTRKLLEERDRSYIRLSFLQSINSLEDESFKAKVSARVSLTRSRKRIKLFIENLDDDNAKNLGKTNDKDSPSFGLERESRNIFGIKPRYSIGFKGIDPFVRARYSLEKAANSWRFRPVQTFTYSLEEEFSELTELYFDKPTSESTLFRFLVDRGTKSYIKGMQYDAFIQWFYKPREHAGLSFNFGANGNTKYINTINELPLVVEEENRMFNYLFLLRWRENFWKKWLFYEISPGINYHETHEYRPNYNIFIGIDMFFGHV